MMVKRLIICLPVLCGLTVCAAGAQGLIVGNDASEAAQVLDSAAPKDSLPCYIEFGQSKLDFLFRYSAGFRIQCRLGGILQSGDVLFALMRITPQGGQPVFMKEEFDIPQVHPSGPSGFNALPNELETSMGGGLATGPGTYEVDFVLTDQHGHTCRKHRTLKSGGRRADKNVPVVLAPGAVAPLLGPRWDGALTPKGMRLTILLNVRSLGDFQDSDSSRRAYFMRSLWGPSDLLQSLASLLNQLPSQSVRLIAFNLDLQRELFREENFDAAGFERLAKILNQTQRSTMTYEALRKNAWAQFLGRVTRSEAADEPQDVIIFMGGWGSHEWDRVPKDVIEKVEISNTHVFYFEYFPVLAAAPDGLERMTTGLHGEVFKIYSPESLAQAIKKASSQLALAPAR